MANRVQCNRCAASLRRTVLIFFDCFSNGHISGALAELIRSTRAPTKDRLKGKIMSGNPVFRGTRVPVHMLAELVPSRACGRTRYRRGSVTLFFEKGHGESLSSRRPAKQ